MRVCVCVYIHSPNNQCDKNYQALCQKLYIYNV